MKQEHQIILKLSTLEGARQHGALDETLLPLSDGNEETYTERSQHSPLSKREEQLQAMKLSKATQTPRWQLSSLQAGCIKNLCKKSSIGDLSSSDVYRCIDTSQLLSRKAEEALKTHITGA
eukprot:4741012-Karenia_brevis.AAC.1